VDAVIKDIQSTWIWQGKSVGAGCGMLHAKAGPQEPIASPGLQCRTAKVRRSWLRITVGCRMMRGWESEGLFAYFLKSCESYLTVHDGTLPGYRMGEPIGG
jgi:hypothetical protein